MISLSLTTVEEVIMSKYIPENHKHLTAADRFYIERQLNSGSSFKDIARYLCKDPSAISKEVRSHRLSAFYPGRGLFLNAKNFCIHRFHCQKKNVCGKIILCDIKCTSYPFCNQHCKEFVKERCNRLERAPYVCNGCDKGHSRCTKSAVRAVFDRLETRLGTVTFRILFETVLTDRGGEFGDPKALENGMDDYQRASFEFLTQWDLNLIVNNINSVPRKSLLGLTPYQTAKENFDTDVLLALQIKPVAPD